MITRTVIATMLPAAMSSGFRNFFNRDGWPVICIGILSLALTDMSLLYHYSGRLFTAAIN